MISQLSGSTCLVTGGAGFIGSHLTSRLIEMGCNVRVLDNLSTGSLKNLQHLHQQFDWMEGDAADPNTVTAAMAGVDFVFHLAAMASVPRSMREPALCHAWCTTSTVNLLEQAARLGVKRLVLASTSAAYGNSSFTAKRETDPPAPLSPYAAAKLAAEMHCAAFYRGMGLETVCLRYFNVFGPRQDPKSEYSAVIPRFVSAILSGQTPVIYGDGMQSRDFVFVADVVSANLLAATSPQAPGYTFNVGRGQSTTLLELLDDLQGILGQEIVPQFEPPRAGDVRESLADISLIRNRLHFEPQFSMLEGLKTSIEYYQSLLPSVSNR